MKALLIAINYYHEDSEFLGLELLNAVLLQNSIASEILQVEYDYPIENYDKLFNNISLDDLLFVGFSPVYTIFREVKELSEYIKNKKPNIHICAGGSAVSNSIKETFEYLKYLDSIVIGEGEITILELLNRLINNQNLNNLEGIAYKQNGMVVINDNRGIINDMDRLPWANRTMIDNNTKIARMQTARGCEGDCSFCAESRIFNIKQTKNPWRGRSVINIVDEMEYIVNEKGIREFDFIDNSFEDPFSINGPNRLYEFAQEIIKRKLNVYYKVMMRTENINKISTSIWKALKKSGLVRVLLGIESGSQDTLNIFSKRATVNQNEIAYKFLLNELKINVIGSFIMFQPYMSIDEILSNIGFIFKIGIQHSYRTFINQIAVFSGTPIFEKMKHDGLLTKDYSITNPYGYFFKDKKVGTICNKTIEVFSLLNHNDELEKTLNLLNFIFDEVIKKEKNNVGLYKLRNEIDIVKGKLGNEMLNIFEIIINNSQEDIVNFQPQIKNIQKTNSDATITLSKIYRELLKILV